VSLGLAGLAAHLILLFYILAAAYRLIKAKNSSDTQGLAFSLVSAFLFLFLANLTGFNFITTEFLYYLLPVLIAAQLNDRIVFNAEKLKNSLKLIYSVLFLGLGFLSYRFLLHYKADVLYQMSYFELNATKNFQMASLYGDEALRANDQEPAIYCHQGQILTNILLQDGPHLNPEVKKQLLAIQDDKVKACAETAINREHYFMQAANQYAQLYEAGLLPSPEKSLENFAKVEALAPNVPISYFRSGVLRLKSGDTAGFENELTKSLQVKENYLPSYFELFQYFYKSGDTVKKARLLESFTQMKHCPTELLELTKSMAHMAEKNKDASAQSVFQAKFEVCSLKSSN
jgi:uncharacterized protein with PQ loop repeat